MLDPSKACGRGWRGKVGAAHQGRRRGCPRGKGLGRQHQHLLPTPGRLQGGTKGIHLLLLLLWLVAERLLLLKLLMGKGDMRGLVGRTSTTGGSASMHSLLLRQNHDPGDGAMQRGGGWGTASTRQWRELLLPLEQTLLLMMTLLNCLLVHRKHRACRSPC